MPNVAGTIQSVPETPESLSGFWLARVKSSTRKLPDITMFLVYMSLHLITYRWRVTAVSSHHTFRSEMSYLNGKSSSICHPWCHHWSASKSASTCSDPPSVSPIPNFLPQLFRHLDSSPNLNYGNAHSQTDSCKVLSNRALSLPATSPFTRARTPRPLSPVTFWR